MKGQFLSKALTPGIAIGALIFAGCSTTETRISGHPEIYQSLSSRDQALVSQGQIRDGMSPNAVYLAWGSPDRKIVGNMRGRPTETWLYLHYTTYYPLAVPSTIHSFIPTYRQVSLIHIRWSLSPVAGSSPSSPWYRRIPDQKFGRVLTKKASV